MERHNIALQPHQQALRDRAVADNLRYPFFLYWSMGSGKTYATCGVMESMVNVNNRQGRVLIMCDKTLEGQWKKAVETYFRGKPSPRVVVQRYQMLNKELVPGKFDFCAVDEAHRFRNAFKSGADVPAEYASWIQQILKCPRVLFLSGTPLVSDAEIDMKGFRMMMQESAANPLAGRVSRYDPQEDDKRKACMYAEVVMHEPVKCHMLWSQCLLYFLSQRSNFVLSFGGETVKLQTSKRNAYNSALRSIANNPFEDDSRLSPKFKSMLADMEEACKNGKRQLVYSSRRDLGARALYELWRQSSSAHNRDSYIIDGSLDAELRTAAVDKFNRRGAKVLFITDAGGQGVDLKMVDVVRLLEPNESVMLENQVINRAVRFRSHKGVTDPKVHVYLYISMFPTTSQALDLRWESVLMRSGLVQGKLTAATSKEIQAAVSKQCIVKDAKNTTVDENVMVRRAAQHSKVVHGNRWIAALDLMRKVKERKEAEKSIKQSETKASSGRNKPNKKIP